MISAALFFALLMVDPNLSVLCGICAGAVYALFLITTVESTPYSFESRVENRGIRRHFIGLLRAQPLILTVFAVFGVILTGIGIAVNWNLFYLWAVIILGFMEGLVVFTVVPLLFWVAYSLSSGLYEKLEGLTEKVEKVLNDK